MGNSMAAYCEEHSTINHEAPDSEVHDLNPSASKSPLNDMKFFEFLALSQVESGEIVTPFDMQKLESEGLTSNQTEGEL